jgi:isopentenyldiphosphate isomerase
MELLDEVNEDDEVVRNLPRKDIYDNLLLHRIVHVIIFNDKGEMAMQMRGNNASFCPGHWCTAAAGHVKAGEAYRDAGYREMMEEIGVSPKLIFMYRDMYQSDSRRKFLGTFEATHNGPFNINKDEVECVDFFTIEKIQEMIDAGEKFHPEFLFLLRKHYGILTF